MIFAAQQREAKEKERAERMAKLAAERAKKQEERKRIEERKRQELEELQRKMRQQEEAEALKKAKAKELEQQKLQQLTGAKPKKMLPPPPKTKYTWEMLHEDDSTDDEGKVTHKRPPAPTWSRSKLPQIRSFFSPFKCSDTYIRKTTYLKTAFIIASREKEFSK